MQSPIKTKKYKMQIQKAVNKKLTTKASKSKGKAVEKQENKRNLKKRQDTNQRRTGNIGRNTMDTGNTRNTGGVRNARNMKTPGM